MSGTQEFDFSIDVLQVLLWQQNRAPQITALLKSKQEWYDTYYKGFWSDWVRDVFDLRTATLFGMSVWAIILGVPLAVILDPDYTQKLVFGFAPFGANFYRSNFGILKQTVLPLTLEQQRLVLQLRYAQLISHGDVVSINRVLKRLFGTYGTAYVVDHLDMNVTYRFEFELPSSLSFVFKNYDILPRPAGTRLRIHSGA